MRKHLEQQVLEYIDRYHPEMRGACVEISPDGAFASVLQGSETGGGTI